MTSGSGGQEAPRDQWERYGPYGYLGFEVGEGALELLAELRRPKPAEEAPNARERTSLDSTDIDAFEALFELDTGIRFIDPDLDLDRHEIGDLHRLFEDLHVAMPFTEAERRWLFWDYKNWEGRGLSAVVGQTVKVLESGVMREIQGDDVVWRWWAWQRERDEFAGQGSLAVARRALTDIAHRLVTAESWPAEYAHLREEGAPPESQG